MLPLRVGVDLGAMAMKGVFCIPQSCSRLKKQKNKRNRIHSKSAEITRNPWPEEEVTHARKRNRPCEKDKFDLTSAGPFRLWGPFFMQSQSANTWPIKFSNLTPCLQLTSRHAERSIIKTLMDMTTPNLGLWTNLSERRYHFIWILEEFLTHRIIVEPRNKVRI